MTQAHIHYSGKNLDFRIARELALSYARKAMPDPVLVAWRDWDSARMSPRLTGCETNSCWHDYGTAHGGELEFFVSGKYDFIFADSREFERYGTSPFIDRKDAHGNEYRCQANAARGKDEHSKEGCVAIEEWSCKLT